MSAHREVNDQRGFTVRSATRDDVDQLATLIHRYQHEIQRYTGINQVAALEHWHTEIDAALSQPGSAYLVAADQQNLLGFCALRIVVRGGKLWTRRRDQLKRRLQQLFQGDRSTLTSAAHEQRLAFMDDLYVIPEARRRGVALPLIRYALDWARAHDLQILEAATWGDNRTILSMARYFDFEVVRVLIRKSL